MKTIGWGIIQIPIVEHYVVCFCIKKDLVYCVSGTGWKLFVSYDFIILYNTESFSEPIYITNKYYKQTNIYSRISFGEPWLS